MGGEKLPDDRRESSIVKIVKKEALSNLSVSSRILAKLIIRQISEAEDQQLRQEQAGMNTTIVISLTSTKTKFLKWEKNR